MVYLGMKKHYFRQSKLVICVRHLVFYEHGSEILRADIR